MVYTLGGFSSPFVFFFLFYGKQNLVLLFSVNRVCVYTGYHLVVSVIV